MLIAYTITACFLKSSLRAASCHPRQPPAHRQRYTLAASTGSLVTLHSAQMACAQYHQLWSSYLTVARCVGQLVSWSSRASRCSACSGWSAACWAGKDISLRCVRQQPTPQDGLKLSGNFRACSVSSRRATWHVESPALRPSHTLA